MTSGRQTANDLVMNESLKRRLKSNHKEIKVYFMHYILESLIRLQNWQMLLYFMSLIMGGVHVESI